MKALDLHTFPIWDAGDGTLYADRDDRRYPTNVGYEVYRKRLTDAELAAEFHNMDSDCQIAWIDGEHTDAMQERFVTLERFATLPHYDEVDQ